MTNNKYFGTFITRILPLAVLLLAHCSAAFAQHKAKNYDPGMRLTEMGISVSDLSYERAQKLYAGYHPLLMGGHRGTGKAKTATALRPTGSNTLAPTKAKAAEDMTFYGYLSHSSEWTEDNFGLYKFNVVPPITFERMPYAEDGPVAADGGGCYYDGKYYSVTFAGFMGIVLAEYCVYDVETWTMEKYIPCEATSVSVDMDFDPTTGNIYGCFYNSSMDGLVFGCMNPETGACKPISSLNRIFFGMAVNSKGQVFGIDEEGNLYRFNKTTGERTLIGNTGLQQEYLGCATFNKKNDKLYWAFINSESSAMYEVNTETAEASLVCNFDHMEEIQGMYIPIPAAEAEAPAKPANVSASFEGPSLAGTLSFTMPSEMYAGGKLSGTIDYDIYIDEDLYSTGKAEAGSEVNASVETSTYGTFRLGVRARNSVGQSPLASTTLWIGKDTPKAVGNLKAEEGETAGDVVLTWTAPTESQHGGYLDVSGLTYQISRTNSKGLTIKIGTTSELTYRDHVSNKGAMAAFSYNVVPLVDGTRTGEVASSNKIGIGSALSLPYHQPFDDESSFDLFTVIDRHGDGKTWEYDPTFQAARAQYDWTNAKNEWLITPPLHLTAERVYKVSYDAWCRTGEKERLEVKFGKGKKHTDMTLSILPRTDIANDTPENHFHIITISEDDDYNFGFHAVSDVDKWWLYLDNISIEAGPLLGTPHRVTNLNVAPAEKGQLKATITFTTPKTTVDGKALDAITSIKVYRNDNLIETLTGIGLGESVTYEDLNAELGDNTYMIVPVNANGDGLEAVQTKYVGVGIPEAPRNICLRKVDGKPVLTWDAPASGLDGTYIEPSELKYNIVRSDSKVVAYGITERTFTDETLVTGDEQAFVTYAVFAESAAGMDLEVFGMSNEVCFGTPFGMPFHESFADRTIQAGPWTWDIIEGDPYLQIVEAGEYPITTAQDEDGGMLSFKPEAKGDEAILYSANISLEGAERPTLTFWYYNNPGSFDKISARIRLDDDPDKVDEVAYINMNGTSGDTGWTMASCDLTKYVGHRIQLLFDFISTSDFYIQMDNISVTGLRDDLPYVTDLTGEYADGMVMLEWSEPIDEIGLGFIGFNVYRNGKLLNEEPLVDPMFEDEDPDGSLDYCTYHVTVVYTEGETRMSNPFSFLTTGIAGMKSGQDASESSIYDLQGRRLTVSPKRGIIIQDGRKRFTLR